MKAMPLGPALAGAVTCSLTLGAPEATASHSFGFDQITANGAHNVATQIAVEVVDRGDEEIELKFTNTGPISSSVANIYIQDGLGIFDEVEDISNGPGVRFRSGSAPGNLPSGANIGFDADFAFSARNPKPHNGLSHGGGWVALLFEIEDDYAFEDLVDAIVDGTVRFGAHVISVGPAGESESIVNHAPAPGAAAIALLASCAALRRRRG